MPRTRCAVLRATINTPRPAHPAKSALKSHTVFPYYLKTLHTYLPFVRIVLRVRRSR